jgi:hypothetical protein
MMRESEGQALKEIELDTYGHKYQFFSCVRSVRLSGRKHMTHETTHRV